MAYVSESSYDRSSPRYDPYALGNQGFFIPSGYGNQYGGGGNLTQQLQQQYQMPYYGQQGGQQGGQPGGQGFYGYQGAMDPWTLQNLYAQSSLQGQTLAGQLQKMQQGRATAEEIAKTLGLTPETTGARTSAMASLAEQPLRQNYEASRRGISDQYARSGTSLSSEYDRSMAEAGGQYAGGLRDIGIWASSEGQNQLMNALLKLYSTFQ